MSSLGKELYFVAVLKLMQELFLFDVYLASSYFDITVWCHFIVLLSVNPRHTFSQMLMVVNCISTRPLGRPSCIILSS
jgi:hypothetical protein